MPSVVHDENFNEMSAESGLRKRKSAVERSEKPSFRKSSKNDNCAPSLSDPSWYLTPDGKKKVAAPLFFVIWQKEISLAAILSFIIAMFIPGLRDFARPFLFLSYERPDGLYGKGIKDVAFTTYWIILFTYARAAFMDYICRPFIVWYGVRRRKTVVRFCEQAWCFVYYFTSWLLSLYLYRTGGYWADERLLFVDYPQRFNTALFKWYYLTQLSFWLQQFVVLHIEERRADHWQMFGHHVITSSLVGLSYLFNITHVGNAILYLFDFSDFILSGSKMMKYMNFGRICDYAFVSFMLSWVYTRHYLYSRIVSVVIHHLPTIIGGLRLDLASGFLFNRPIYYNFIFLLVFLQVLVYLWFAMIVKVAFRVVTGAGAVDSRSDDEGGDQKTAQSP
ncbi:sphingosine N-acyltransferase Lag1 [Schizosaccharomyces japonicus yFS275]|uniref:Sphingosine N-acyltransferase Lag1 n=1 Tax=Schizosaccharomyces japonicus (strain yFS275 / FY16936) TaxID=402676 RepID=B6JZP3_SCHJY|nr:sphingosine N-acyltransferase Lag1 [Schizosaccharomyces japonicus yFS275]EEB07011.1 sphingosine N-acyltransferase Lag1 [Schizosaccharomyces japonicus yFS275]